MAETVRQSFRLTKPDQRPLKLINLRGGWGNQLSAQSERLLPGGMEQIARADSSRVALQMATSHLPAVDRRYQVDVHSRTDSAAIVEAPQKVRDRFIPISC